MVESSCGCGDGRFGSSRIWTGAATRNLLGGMYAQGTEMRFRLGPFRGNRKGLEFGLRLLGDAGGED